MKLVENEVTRGLIKSCAYVSINRRLKECVIIVQTIIEHFFNE